MWLAIGFVAGGLVLALVMWLRNRGTTVAWYEWLIGAIGLILVVFSLQNVLAFEHEAAYYTGTANVMFLLIFALPGIILLAVTWQLIARRARAA